MTDITEEQARQMEAGPELDRLVLTGFFGWEAHDTCGHRKMDGRSTTTAVLFGPESDFDLFGTTRCNAKSPPPFSTGWAAAGPLLEVMRDATVTVSLTCDDTDSGGVWRCYVRTSISPVGRAFSVGACTPCLAIARTCAVLVARGITRDDLEVK